MKRHAVIATAGHVDHGKSSLVRALTGIDPDRLPEEKARGITIDLGFARLALPSRGGPDEWELGVVDVPGHEDFIKNMVAGVGAASLAILVVAADDGWMAQTEEHLQILAYLQVPRLIVALTKIDRATTSIEELALSVRQNLQGSPYATDPIVPVSSFNGQGLAELKSVLASVMEQVPLPIDYGKPRMSVDRVFTLRGVGTVATGTLSGGTFRKGQAVTVQPQRVGAQIRTLQIHNREVESAGPGTRLALNLPALQVNGSVSGSVLRRGDVVTFSDSGEPSQSIEVLLTRSSRPPAGQVARAQFKHGAEMRVHIGSTNTLTGVILPDCAVLPAGAASIAQLRLSSPLWVCQGDRFILRDLSGRETLAGGIVLNVEPRPRKFRNPTQQNYLAALARSPGDVISSIQARVTRDGWVARSGLLLQSGFSAQAIAEAVDELARLGLVALTEDLLIDRSTWQSLCQRAAQIIDAYHREHPSEQGMVLNQLRTDLAEVPSSGFETLVNWLVAHGFSRIGHVIHRSDYHPGLPRHLQASSVQICTRLALKPLDPPSRKELAPDLNREQALRFLVQTRQVIELGGDIVLLGIHFAKAREAVVQVLRRRGAASVSELRQALGASRRVVVPLLEKLDRDGLTLRTGDKRILRHAAGPSPLGSQSVCQPKA